MMPNMGTNEPADAKSPQVQRGSTLAAALFTGTQQRVLGLLFGATDAQLLRQRADRVGRRGIGRGPTRIGAAHAERIADGTARRQSEALSGQPGFAVVRGAVQHRSEGFASGARVQWNVTPSGGGREPMFSDATASASMTTRPLRRVSPVSLYSNV